MDCCDHCQTLDPHRGSAAYRRALWAVLGINAVMFLIEIGAGVAAGLCVPSRQMRWTFSVTPQTTRSAFL
jgi:hypothetical protein